MVGRVPKPTWSSSHGQPDEEGGDAEGGGQPGEALADHRSVPLDGADEAGGGLAGDGEGADADACSGTSACSWSVTVTSRTLPARTLTVPVTPAWAR